MKTILVMHNLFVVLTMSGGVSKLHTSRVAGKKTSRTALAAWSVGLHGMLISTPLVSTKMNGVSMYLMLAAWGVVFLTTVVNFYADALEQSRF